MGGPGGGYDRNDLHDHVLGFSLETDGFQYITQVEKELKQEELLKRQTIAIEKSQEQSVLVSQSQIESNNATTTLYTRTEKYYRSQRDAAWVIVLLTAGNLFLGIATFMQTCGRRPQQKEQQLRSIQPLPEKTEIVQKEIGVSHQIREGKDSLSP